MSIGERLKSARKRIGISQEELAASAGIPVSTYRNYEQGLRKLNSGQIACFATILGVSTDYLLEMISEEAEEQNRERQWLMDAIYKADSKKLVKLRKLMELIDEDENRDG